MRSVRGCGFGVRRRLGGLPKEPKICLVRSRASRVVCIKGTVDLGGHIQRCFRDDEGGKIGVRRVMARVHHFRCVIASSRLRTLILRYGLVGRRQPGCGAVLVSSGTCPFVGIAAKRTCPHVVLTQRVGGSGTHCFNPCADSRTIQSAVSLVRGLCRVEDYGHSLPGSVKGRHPYLGCRVGRYRTPYRKCVSRRRCQGSVSRIVQFLGKGFSVVLGSLRSGVVTTSRTLRFRGTVRCERLLGDIGGITRGRGVASSDKRSESIVTITYRSRSTIMRIFFVHNKELVKESRFCLEVDRRSGGSRVLGDFVGRCCTKAPFLPNRLVLPRRVRRRRLLRS